MGRVAAFIFTGLILVGALAGCSKPKAAWETVYPASGVLTFGGKPISGAQVTLFPTDPAVPESVRPTAVTEADGRFKLSTFAEGDGAPRGSYNVSVIWHPVVFADGGAVRGANQLPQKYARPDSSDIKVDVAEGGTVFPTIDIPGQ